METETFENYRPLLFSIAYRMLGSAMEAEDIVQETFLRYQATPPESIRALKPFLTTITTRLCLDQLKSARLQREQYIGPWLPEPVFTHDGAWLAPNQSFQEYETISMAFLVLLENLSPAERAVFLLREVFDYDYPEIAGIIDKEEAACRQLFHRAKKHIDEQRPRYKSSPEEHQQITGKFMQAINEGDVSGLVTLLADEVGLWSDGGGKVGAATRPLFGRDTVLRFLAGLARQRTSDYKMERVEINGAQAVMVRDPQGAPFVVITLDVGDGLIQAFRLIRNPDKLAYVS